MKFEVDIEKLIQFDIDINHYLFLQFVYNQDYKLLEKYLDTNSKFFNKDSIDYLLSIGLLEFVDEEEYLLSKLKISDKFIEEFMEDQRVVDVKASTTQKVEEWIDEWYDLWPKGVKSGGYLVRSGVKGCLIKMKNFLKDNKEYDKDIIMKATKDYINLSRMNNYKFMQLAHYYISKNNMSTLMSNCELITEKGKVEEISYIDDI